MKSCYFESEIFIKINFPDEPDDTVEAEHTEYIKTKSYINKLLSQFGFEMFNEDSSSIEYYTCYSKDNLLDLITQRSKFVMKLLQNEKEIVILNFKIKSVLVDSLINDDIFPLKINK